MRGANPAIPQIDSVPSTVRRPVGTRDSRDRVRMRRRAHLQIEAKRGRPGRSLLELSGEPIR
jgi:hypothetical protein